MTDLRVSDWRAGVGGLATHKRLGRLVVDGTMLEVATDGFAAAVVACEQSVLPDYPNVAAAATIKTLHDIWRHAVPDGARKLSLGRLLDAIGTIDRPRRVECPECRGRGRHPDSDPTCECDCCACEFCESEDGRIDHEPRRVPVFVEGFLTRFDANRLGLAVTCIGGLDRSQEVTLSDMPPRLGAVMVAGDGWRVVVMGMTHYDDDGLEWRDLFADATAPARAAEAG